MDQIFNELSVSACYLDKYAAQAGMELAIDVSLSMAELGMAKTIRTVGDFKTRYLSENYSVDDWARDKDVNRLKKLYFLTHATKSPYIEKFYEEKEQETELFEHRFEGELALGLGLAHLWGISSVSLGGDDRFARGRINISEYKLASGIESNHDIPVFTFSNKDQVRVNIENVQKGLYSSIGNGLALIENADEMLPFLAFAPKVVDQVRCLRGTEQFFPEVLRHLFILNATMREWPSGPFVPKLDFSTESTSTMNNKTFAKQRSFICVDRIERQFHMHSKIRSSNKRIYFYPQTDKRMVHIGYIGDHLPTTKFPT